MPNALRRSKKYLKILKAAASFRKVKSLCVCVFHLPVAYIERVDRNKMAGYRKLQIFVISSTSKSRFFRMSVS